MMSFAPKKIATGSEDLKNSAPFDVKRRFVNVAA